MSRSILFISILVFLSSIPQFGKVKPLYLYYNQSYGARALSMGNAFTAVADDLSAVYKNPAGIAEFDHPQLYLDYRSDRLSYAHDTETDTSGTTPRSYAYQLTSTLKNADFLSISAPVTFWGMKWNFALSYYRFIPYNVSAEENGQLTTAGITDTASLVINGRNGIDVLGFTGAFYLFNNFSAGITVQRFFNSGSINYSYTLPGSVSYTNDYSEKINGWNMILGLLFKLDRDIALGFSYQSRLRGPLDSDLTYQDTGTASNPVTSSSLADVNLPPQFSMGVMVRPFALWTLSADYSILYWSKADVSNYFSSTATLPFPVRDDFTFSQQDNINLRTGTEIKIPFKRFTVFIRGGIFKERQLFTDASDGYVNVTGYSLGLGLDVSSRIRLDLGYMRQNSSWKETGYFDSASTVNSNLKNNTLCLAATVYFGPPF
ncbi:MAG: OmpP1/FadL family transporter [Candidatus Omnitrophota bacterium]